MKYIDEFRNKEASQHIASEISEIAGDLDITLMEVCGTHTMSIYRYGIKKMLPKNIRLLSGPGCPVCVTDDDYIDKVIELSSKNDVIITTFGDMMRVPGTESNLDKQKANGHNIKIVYSVIDALKIAKENPEMKVIFLGVGFETTVPTIASAVMRADNEDIKNFLVMSANKLIPPAMEVIVKGKKVGVDGFICPAHVSTIIGAQPYKFLSEQYNIPCVIAGFEATDILQSIYLLVKQLIEKRSEVEIQYTRAVKAEGNRKAIAVIDRVFENDDAQWRGIGVIQKSGLKIKEEFKDFDAENLFRFEYKPVKKNKGCICGSVLQGINTPDECKLFRKVCTPESPVGPCMVSSEGTCAAYYKYT